MSRRSYALVVALFGLVLTILLWFSSEDKRESEAGQRVESEREARAGLGPGVRVVTGEEARRVSPPGWMPPEVFREEGEAVVAFEYPRGENGRRRFAEAKAMEVPMGGREAAPVVLAQMPADRRTHLRVEEVDLHTRVGRRLAFDPGALDAVLAGETSEILVPSVDQEVVVLVIHGIKTRDLRTHTFSGKVKGEEGTSVVQLVYHDGILHGNVVRYATGQELEYRILADGFLMVRELDQESMSDPCGGALTSAEELAGAAGVPEGEEGVPSGDTPGPGNRVLDLVVGYGRAARIADGGRSQIEARILASVDRMNLAFVNSAISNAEVMLLGVIEDPDYEFPGVSAGDMGEELGNLNSTTDGVLDAVSDYRAELGADFVSFVVSQADGSAGIAYRPGRESVTSRTYMTGTRITFAHELGHNIGCDHSWGDSTQAYKKDYGWRLAPPGATRVRTIMAYDWGWGSGHRIPYFANPEVEFSGARTGAVVGYDVMGDATADQRYEVGGLGYNGSDPTRTGFNGLNPALAAMNAETIASGNGNTSLGMGRASSRSARIGFNVVSPGMGEQWAVLSTQSIFFTGGDMEDRAEIRIYRNGVLALPDPIVTNLNPATGRRFDWQVPVSLPVGTGYLIEVTLNRNGGQEVDTSGLFEITGNSPQVISHSPSPTSVVVGEVSDLKITFNRSMDPGSFSVVDDVVSFTGPGGVDLKATIAGSTWTNSDTTLTIAFAPVSSVGSYLLVLGSGILDTQGTPLDQDQDLQGGEVVQDRYLANFEISSLGVAVDAPSLVWTSSGAADWFPQKEVTFDGVDAAQSGVMSDNEISSLETTVVGPGNLSFRWKIDSEANYDWLEFYLGGVLQTGGLGRISGDVDWVLKSVAIPAGAQTLRWTYRKDQSVSTGADAAWLDEVNYLPDTAENFEVSFRGNDNSGGSLPATESHPAGFSLSIPGNIGGLWKSEFSFAGWNTAADGNGTDYQPGATYLVVGDLVLFAKWNALPVVGAGADRTISLAGGGSWSPQLLNPEAWYDAQDAATVLIESGGVSQWLDKSGNGRHATQTNGGARPVLVPSANHGGPAIGFDGSASFFEVDFDYLAETSHSAFVVTRTTGYSNIYGAATPNQGSNSLHIGFRDSSSYRTNYWGNNWYGSISLNFDANGRNVMNFVWTRNTQKEVFANGWSEGTRLSAGNIGTMSGGGRIGRVTGHPFYGGEISEMIFYTGDLLVDDRRLVEGYLAHKWGRVDRLPGNHPYKLSSPTGASIEVTLNGSATDNESDPLSVAWTVDSGPEGVSFDNPFQMQPVVTFTLPGVYDLRLTVTDGFGERSSVVTITVTDQTLYEAWAGGSFVEPFSAQGLLSNPDGDAFKNLQEFAFGMDPTDGTVGGIEYALNGAVTSSGPPMIENLTTGPSEELHVVFARRKDHVAAELTYTVEFTADLGLWTATAAVPVTMTDAGAAGEMEVVAVPFPAAVPLTVGGSGVPLFYRIGVAMPE